MQQKMSQNLVNNDALYQARNQEFFRAGELSWN